MGLIQLSTGSPALPPAGTRPDAMAPATAPKQYGTSTDEVANSAPKARRSRVRSTAWRNAKPEPAQHDAERRDGEGHEQRERDRRVGLGEARPEHHEAEDQPHVVGLPHGPDRVVDHPAGTITAVGAAGDEVPEPGAEVGAAEDRVGE